MCKKRINLKLMALAILAPIMGWAQTDSVTMQSDIREVVVTHSNERDKARLPMTLSVVKEQVIKQSHNSSLLPTLGRQVPGLFVTSRGVMGYGVSTGAAGGMTMRGIGGSPSTGMLVMVDGQPQVMGLMGHPIADACQSMLAEKVEVVRGPASVVHGSNAMGGVINIVTRQMMEDGVENDVELGYGSFNSLQASYGNRIRKNKFSSTASVNYNRTDSHRANMGFDQLGAMLRLSYDLGKSWSLMGVGNLTRFSASNPGTVSSPILENDSRIARYSSSLTLRNNYASTAGEVSLFYNYGSHTINDGYSPGQSPLDYLFNSRDKSYGVSFHQGVSLFEGNHIMVGADYRHSGGKAWNSYTNGDANKLLANREIDNVALYVSVRQRVKERLNLDAGLRFDHHSQAGEQWVPQVGATYQLRKAAELRASVSKGFRYPTIRELFMFPSQNPDLKAEKILNYELALKQSLLEGTFSYEVNIYYINGDNIIRTLPVDGRPKNVNTGKVENWGVECQAQWMLSPQWSLTANYSYLDMKYPVVAAPKHKAYAGVGYSKGRLMLNSSVQHIAGLVISTDPALTQKGFTLWDATAEVRLTKMSKFFLRVDNILGQEYEINAGYPMPRTTFMTGLNFKF